VLNIAVPEIGLLGAVMPCGFGAHEMLAANSFNPTWIVNDTPLEGWPPGDGPEQCF
jgi:hypothetical protein